MTEINIEKISIAHQGDKIIKMFDNADECLDFADYFENEYGIKLKCDTIYSFLCGVEAIAYRKGFKDGFQ